MKFNALAGIAAFIIVSILANFVYKAAAALGSDPDAICPSMRVYQPINICRKSASPYLQKCTTELKFVLLSVDTVFSTSVFKTVLLLNPDNIDAFFEVIEFSVVWMLATVSSESI